MLTPKVIGIIVASFSAATVGVGTAGVVYGATKPAEEIIVPPEEGEKGLVYLHKDINPLGETYNGEDDWYYTEEYERLGPGFAKRDEPYVENYKGIGWARVDTPIEYDKETWREPTTEDILDDEEWPVRPQHNMIAHLYPMYELEKTTFTFKDSTGKELCNPLTDSCKEQTSPRAFRDPNPEDIKHSTFSGWMYGDDYEIKIKGKTEPRAKGTLVTEDDKMAEFTSKTVNLVAKLDASQYCATFLNDDDSIFDTIWADIDEEKDPKEASITPEAVAKINEPEGKENEEFFGWKLKDGTESVTWPYPIKDNKTQFKPIFKVANISVSVNLDNAEWKNDEGETQAITSPVDINVVPDEKYSSNELTDKVRIACGVSEDYYLVGTDTPKTNFEGWYFNGSVEPSYTFENKTGQTISAAFNDIDNITVTFNTAGGYFNCENLYGEVESVTSLSIDINIPAWKEEEGHEGKVKLSDVYKTLLGNDTKLVHDGYDLNEDEGDYGNSGWLYMGNNLPKDYNITTSISLFAEWVEKAATGNWWTDDWYTIAKLADEPADDPTKATYTGTKLEEVYGSEADSAFKGTKADAEGKETKEENTFVGLQKEISLPQLGFESLTTRVIGQGQDTISESNSKALLTFDFVDCPAAGPFGFKNDYKDDSASFNNSSTKSSIRAAMPEGLRNSLKTVTKWSMDSFNGSAPTPESFNTDLFLLSATEVNGVSNQSAKIETDKGNNNFFTYAYYSQYSPNDIGTSEGSNQYRFKYYGIGESKEIISWWTRTPSHTSYYFPETGAGNDNSANAWYVSTNEHVSSDKKPYSGGLWMYGCREARGISPAFCIGTYLGQ